MIIKYFFFQFKKSYEKKIYQINNINFHFKKEKIIK